MVELGLSSAVRGEDNCRVEGGNPYMLAASFLLLVVAIGCSREITRAYGRMLEDVAID